MNKCPVHTCLKKNGSACRINDHASRSPFYCSISKCPVVPVFIHGTVGQHGTDGTRPSRFRKTIKGDFAKNIKRVLYKTMPVSRVATDENSKSPAFHLTIPKQKDCESRDCPKCPEVSHRPNPWKDGTWDSGTRRGSNKNQPTELTLGMVNYSLQKYKGTATRHTCPNCGDRHSFAYYVDDSGVPLHPSVGRCNHESSCGYHYTPKEYFHDRPECRTAKSFSYDKNKTERKTGQASRQTVTGYISPQYVERSQSVHSNFFRFISSLLGSYYGSKAKEVLRRLLEEYRLGATRDGAVIFWQIDRENKVHTGKVMQYNPENGHRIKGGEALAVDWIHCKLKRQRVLPEEWQLSQCLFGEHLLNVYPDKVAVLVESEKSAVIGSAIFPDYVWLAAGGKSQMREEKLRVLAGRTVLLFPDADAYAEWKQRAECMSFCKVIVSDLIEKNATPEQKAAHIDIADWIVFQIRESKIMCTASHLVEAERILGRMIDKNPVLQKLIDELDLVLVGAAPICNGSADPP